jgi:hypothetical protein
MIGICKVCKVLRELRDGYCAKCRPRQGGMS